MVSKSKSEEDKQSSRQKEKIKKETPETRACRQWNSLEATTSMRFFRVCTIYNALGTPIAPRSTSGEQFHHNPAEHSDPMPS